MTILIRRAVGRDPVSLVKRRQQTRTHAILLLAVGLTLAACEDNGGPPEETEGTLVVSTSTGGNDPDHDGYLLTVDGVDSLVLVLTGTAEIDLPAGQHTLQLLGVADHCSVAPVNPVEVEVPPHSTVPVAFEISCPLTGARITTTTTGLDFDSDGYRLVVDGSDLRTIFANNTITLSRLDPGSRTIALTGLASNCAIDGPVSRTVTIVAAELVPIEFAVVCTAASGLIRVIVDASGTDVEGRYEARVDGAGHFRVGPGGPAYLHLSAGNHVVALIAPANCSVHTGPQSVTLTGGGLIHDTVEVTFSVTCVEGFGTLRITARTTGPAPEGPIRVSICDTRYDNYSCVYYQRAIFLGDLELNGTLVAQVAPGSYHLELWGVPATCSAGFSRSTTFTLANGGTVDFDVTIDC